MLDINAPNEGDVKAAFVPFDYDQNLTLFRSLCAGYELKVSEEDAIELMQLFETFSKAEGQ